MTAPTTHDTRTVILTDEAIRNEDPCYTSALPEIHAYYKAGHGDGCRFARSIYEPHVAKLEAEIAALKAMVPKLVTHKEFEEYAGRWWLVATFGHYGDLLLIVPMNQPIPLPAAPTQGVGEG